MSESSAFAPTIPNKNSPPGKAPEGMVWIPGGEFSMGAAMAGQGSAEMPMASNDSGPIHRVRVDGFWMDTTPVTNEQFEKFVKATGYVTIAERKPTKEEYPTAPGRKSHCRLGRVRADRPGSSADGSLSMVELP